MKKLDKNNSATHNPPTGSDGDNFIEHIKKVVSLLESREGLDIATIKKELSQLKTSGGTWIHRAIEFRSNPEDKDSNLYMRLLAQKDRIHSILHLGEDGAKNDPQFICVDQPNIYRESGSSIYPMPDEEQIISDIKLLFFVHSPILTENDYMSNIRDFETILVEGLRNGMQYESRIAEYLADSEKFFHDFFSGLEKIKL